MQGSHSGFPRYSGLIFDLDGTITRTNELIFDTFNHVTDAYINNVYSPDEITRMFGPPEDGAIGRLIGSEKLEAAMNDFYAYYEEHHEGKAEIHEGMYEILRSLHRSGTKLGLFTGKGSVTTQITLKKFGIDRFFHVIVTGHDVQKHKPSGEGIQLALSRMDIPPSKACMIGDSVADVRSSRDAGVDMAAVLWDSYAYDKVRALDTTYKFYSVDELRRWIEEHIISYT